MITLGIIAACNLAHKFVGGNMGPGYHKYEASLDRGNGWLYQPRSFRMDGDKVIMVVKLTHQDVPESESGTMILDGDTLTVTKANAMMTSKVVFKKVQE
jgi:hypothetical protein